MRWLTFAWPAGRCVAAAIGGVLQKRAHTRNDERPLHLQSSKLCGGALCNAEWLVGFLLFAIAPIPFAMLSLALAGQSLIMPLTGEQKPDNDISFISCISR